MRRRRRTNDIVPSSLLICFLVQMSLPDLTDCCFKQNSLDAPSLSAPPHSSRRVHRVHQLNTEGDALAVTRLRAFQGEFIYGRIEVPRSQSGMTLTVTAVWETNAFTSPLWLYARKDDLPTESHYDKTGISFVSRKYARVRYEAASPGSYFVMVEAIDDVGDFSFIVSIDRAGDDGGGGGVEGGGEAGSKRGQSSDFPVVRPVWSQDVDRTSSDSGVFDVP